MSKSERDFLAIGGLFITLIGIFFVIGIMTMMPAPKNRMVSLLAPVLGIGMFLTADFHKSRVRRRAQRIKALRLKRLEKLTLSLLTYPR